MIQPILFAVAVLAAPAAVAEADSAAPDPTVSDPTVIEESCKRTGLLYAHYFDTGQAGKIADLFADNGVWQVAVGSLSGPDEIRPVLEGDQQQSPRTSLHVITNQMVTVDSATEASGRSYFTLYRQPGQNEGLVPLEGQPFAVGFFEDKYVIADGECKFKQRRVLHVFSRRDTVMSPPEEMPGAPQPDGS